MLATIVKYLPIYWAVWFFGFLPITFAIPEFIALKNKGMTLSMFTWIISQEWPPIIFILGLLVGGLAVHFWWHWSPPSIGSLGGTGG